MAQAKTQKFYPHRSFPMQKVHSAKHAANTKSSKLLSHLETITSISERTKKHVTHVVLFSQCKVEAGHRIAYHGLICHTFEAGPWKYCLFWNELHFSLPDDTLLFLYHVTWMSVRLWKRPRHPTGCPLHPRFLRTGWLTTVRVYNLAVTSSSPTRDDFKWFRLSSAEAPSEAVAEVNLEHTCHHVKAVFPRCPNILLDLWAWSRCRWLRLSSDLKD